MNVVKRYFMYNKENKKQIMSKRMKNIYMQSKICSHLILTEINGIKIFLLDRLTDEEKQYIEKEWCNCI